MKQRPLHVLPVPPGAPAGMTAWLAGALETALDGTGPAIMPVDAALPPPRLAALIEALAPDAVATPEGTSRLSGGPGVDRVGAVFIATSGSTGEPKGVELPASALLHSARASLERIGARPGDRWLCPLPVSHISGLGILVRSLVAGTTPVLTQRAGEIARVAALGCAHASFVPTQLRRLLARGADVASFRTILLGGAAAPPALLASAREAGARVVTTYGMSETCGGCVYDGMPLDGVTVTTGADGTLEIAGPVLFARYRGVTGLTDAAAPGRFVTSDLGTVDADGRVTVLGRADEMINTGGEKVAPAAVAAALEACPGVREAAVVGVPDPEWGERVTAIVVPEDPGHPPVLTDLRARVRERLPAFAAPRAMMAVATLPLLPSGKPDLAALRTLGSRA